jgi:cytochrome c2
MRSLVLTMFVVALGCTRKDREAASTYGGDAIRGKSAIGRYGCPACHEIPGIPGAAAKVGPSLKGFGARGYVAGKPKTVEVTLDWIMHPKHLHPDTPMPEMNVTEADARDIATYLSTLR